MKFAAVRLGKDSKADIKKIEALKESPATPVVIQITCAQLPEELDVGATALIWFSAASNKVATTEWKQGLRALGSVSKIVKRAKYSEDSTFEVAVKVVLSKSYDQKDMLRAEPQLYSRFGADMPVIGVRDWSGQTVRMIEPQVGSVEIEALFELLGRLEPKFIEDLKTSFPEFSGVQASAPLPKGRSVIYYGAPGAGKSRRALDDAKALGATPDSIIRTVFHTEYSRGDFIGKYQPLAVQNGAFPITYSFVPGPLIRAIVKAVTSTKAVVLIVEEINRANACAVFGEAFQLLDRKSTGESEYIVPTDGPLAEYLKVSAGDAFKDGLFLPSNLSIFATMNSADQGVQHLDTAFKRRWQFVYQPLAYGLCPWKGHQISISGSQVTWENFGTTINRRLASLKVPEDRLIGPFFLSEADLGEKAVLVSKLLLYLWDDVLRFQGRERVFDSALIGQPFSKVAEAFETGKQVFEASLHEELFPRVVPTKT